MLQKLGEKGLWKLVVYFTYLCAQVVILGALMLTTTSMVAHTIMMLLTIVFYFAVCFKDPGTYIANSQPNLQDLSTSHKSKADLKSKYDKKKVVSDRIPEKNQSQQNQIEQQIKKPSEAQLKGHKKISINLSVKDELDSKQVRRQVQIEKQSAIINCPKEKQNLIVSAKNILNSAFNNLTTFMSKKNIQTGNQQEKSVIKEQTQIKEQASVKVEPKQIIEQNKLSLEQQRQEEQKCKVKPVQKDSTKSNKRSICYRMQHKKRYCRICQFYQPMRVRHCYSCQSCVSTFDHHCPWLSTCIGQKNKLLFIGYLFAQTLQFFVIFIDLAVYISQGFHANRSSVGILLLAVILIFIVLVLLLSFHLYLAFNNLTTWELFRWDRIQYLALFDKTILRSPFSKGLKQNMKILWKNSFQSSNKRWEDQLTEDLSKYVLKGKYSERQQGVTERKMFLSHQNI